MPRARRNNLPPPPAGWDEIEDTVNAFEQKLKEAVDETHEGKRLAETQWKLHQVNHQRSRFIYEKFYKVCDDEDDDDNDTIVIYLFIGELSCCRSTKYHENCTSGY